MASKFAMKPVFTTLSLSLCVWFPFVLDSPPVSRSSDPSYGRCVYDSNPEQIWNRLFFTLFIRQYKERSYGADELDPLLWTETQFLLSEPSHGSALHILDEFLEAQGQNQVHDLVKKAVLEHDLWAVFDWSARRQDNYAKERRDLQIRLAEVLHRLALSKNEIASLTDNYEAAVKSGEFPQRYDPDNRGRAFLPPDLFRADGPWVCIRGGPSLVSKLHVIEFSGRSRFVEFIRLPQGRKATLDYLHALWAYPDPWGGEFNATVTNPGVPDFPAGTELALVRQMNLFDRAGSLVSAPITESVQIRVFGDVLTNGGPNSRHDRNAAATSQDVYEIKLDRAKFFSGKSGGLRAVRSDEQEFRMLRSFGFDFEGAVRVLDDCATCHTGSGIHSVISVASLLKPSAAQMGDPENYRYEGTATLFWKQYRYDWGLLDGYWKNLPVE
jgi:hypothetical protein